MKILSVCILMFVSAPAVCQGIPNPGYNLLLKDTMILLGRPHSLNLPQLWNRIDSTSYGIVYAMPLDNMPCIIPEENPSQRMPNFGLNKRFKILTDPGIYRDNKIKSERGRYYFDQLPKTKKVIPFRK